ncbi:hypothetical protein [Thomasclavelia cocleata]|jgi:hypothetical protein|uniref:hypothetical protein n=1 Tax=Thomasclavelia cocleata TaxID=69824 RepID=UPI002432C864|nr:hypothetical protein [Thomasclavelia cocleata]MCI9630132.1 hypothetical protein [Thomasclavelia cocleata]
MKNRKDILVLILLVICIIGMLVVKYCYEQAVINSTTALILNDILGIPCTVVILYYIYIYKKERKRKFKSCEKKYLDSL